MTPILGACFIMGERFPYFRALLYLKIRMIVLWRLPLIHFDIGAYMIVNSVVPQEVYPEKGDCAR